MSGDARLPIHPRVERSRAEVSAFLEDLAAWCARRAEDDRDQRHASQLTAVGSLLRSAASVLEGELDAVASGLAAPTPPAPGDVYERCLLVDRRIGWLQRLWKFFRDLFDQRDSQEARPLLDAADDIVWACYRPVMEAASQRGLIDAIGSPPLPYLEFELSPSTTPATVVPRMLGRDGNDAALMAVLRRLPFAAVSLPAASLRSPWWLVFAAHEAGHAVQAELGLVEPFRAHIASAVRDRAGAFEAEQWSNWADEIFADYYSVLMVGPAALRGLLEFEVKTPPSMRRRPSSYPPSAVRLALLASLLGALGFDAKGALAGVDPAAIVAGDTDAEGLLALVPIVAGAARADLPGLPSEMEGPRTLESLCAFDRSELIPLFPAAGEPPTLLSPRQIMMASVAQWDEIERDPDAARRKAGLADLAALTLRCLRAARMPGERNLAAPLGFSMSEGRVGDATEHGRALATALMSMKMPEEGP